MIKVITYGTFDFLHQGHINILKRAKELGDYLVVGVTADDFDKKRGKINVSQSLMERIEGVRATGFADEIIVEEYEGQKIDDICRLSVDIFTVGSDWEGKFDYLKEYCEVVYLPRTEGVSSSKIREEQQAIKLGLLGESSFISKFERESHYVNGIQVTGVCTKNIQNMTESVQRLEVCTNDYCELLNCVDAVYIHSQPTEHYQQIKEALCKGKNVLVESPMALNVSQVEELFELAEQKQLILQECIKTAYIRAYSRMLLLLKSGLIGDIVSVDATCTSLNKETDAEGWNSLYSWGPTALLPIFQILGTNYTHKSLITSMKNGDENVFSKMDFVFSKAVATIKVGKGVKSEGELVISGTKGYVYVPAPWWKTDYFEVRYENQNQNKRYFYQLDGEGIRHELLAFAQAVRSKKQALYISKEISLSIAKIMADYNEGVDVKKIEL